MNPYDYFRSNNLRVSEFHWLLFSLKVCLAAYSFRPTYPLSTDLIGPNKYNSLLLYLYGL